MAHVDDDGFTVVRHKMHRVPKGYGKGKGNRWTDDWNYDKGMSKGMSGNPNRPHPYEWIHPKGSKGKGKGKGRSRIQIKDQESPEDATILDHLTDQLSTIEYEDIDEYKRMDALYELRKNWRRFEFGRVVKVTGMGPKHYILHNKDKANTTTWIGTEEEYEELAKDIHTKKRITVHYEYGYYMWVRLSDGEFAYGHHSNYRQPDFFSNSETKFKLNDIGDSKTPNVGDHICGIVNTSTRYSDKHELTEWFVSSYTFYRCATIVTKGREHWMFKRDSPLRIIASMVTRGNELINGKDDSQTMTPINCEDAAFQSHYIYAAICMIMVFGRRPKNADFGLPLVANTHDFLEFLTDFGQAKCNGSAAHETGPPADDEEELVDYEDLFDEDNSPAMEVDSSDGQEGPRRWADL